jgi:HD-GYP domain-containing protein (c-di-GMP phosphodiesterase class II)
MTRDRGYQRGVPNKQAALEELRTNSGTRFDLEVAAVLVQITEETGDRRSGFAG